MLTTQQRERLIELIPRVEEALEILGEGSIVPGSFRGDLSRLRNRLPELRHYLGRPEDLGNKELEIVHSITKPLVIVLQSHYDIVRAVSSVQELITGRELPTPDAMRMTAKCRDLLLAWGKACRPICDILHPDTFAPAPVEQGAWHYFGKKGEA